MKEVTTSALLEMLENKEVKVVDVRPVEAYNGWKLLDEIRGGHIRGARSLPAKWADYIDWIEVVRHKDILPDHHVVVYGYLDEQAAKVAKRYKGRVRKSLCIQWFAVGMDPLSGAAYGKASTVLQTGLS